MHVSRNGVEQGRGSESVSVHHMGAFRQTGLGEIDDRPTLHRRQRSAREVAFESAAHLCNLELHVVRQKLNICQHPLLLPTKSLLLYPPFRYDHHHPH